MTDLRNKIARAAYENRVALIESDAERQNWPAWDEHEEADADEWRDMADAVLAVIDVGEIRAEAQVEALRDAADDWHEERVGTRPGLYKWLWDRADRIAREAGVEIGEEAGA